MTLQMSRGEVGCNRLIMWPQALRRRESEEDETNSKAVSELMRKRGVWDAVEGQK